MCARNAHMTSPLKVKGYIKDSCYSCFTCALISSHLSWNLYPIAVTSVDYLTCSVFLSTFLRYKVTVVHRVRDSRLLMKV